MRPCFHVEIVTPKRYVLNGLWWGPKKAKRAIIFVHGLTGTVFSAQNIVSALVDDRTAVLTFNNRGFGKINSVKKKVGRELESVRAGSAHEVFTESHDDIQGAINTVKKMGVKNVYLAGHSTGCQKAVYWAYKNKGGRAVQGIILLGPVSDYAAGLKDDKKGKLKKATALAQKLVRAGKKHELLPTSLLTHWSVDDAQRFLSLYTPDSIETMFSYEQPAKNPNVLKSVKTPILVLWAAKDAYADRPAKTIANWFEKHIRAQNRVVIVPRVGHGFKGGEKVVSRVVRNFMKEA